MSELPGLSPILQVRGNVAALPIAQVVPDTAVRREHPSAVPGIDGTFRGENAPMPSMRATFRGNPVDVDLDRRVPLNPVPNMGGGRDRDYDPYYDDRTATNGPTVPGTARRDFD